MEPKNIFVRLATLGPVGYVPASGTVATLMTLPLIYALSLLNLSVFAYGLVVGGATFVGMSIIGRALEHFKMRDPSEIVLDELLGCLTVFWGVPISFGTMLIGFVAFRVFDILKPFGIRKCEVLYGSLGVVMDDVLAAVFANLVVRLAIHYW